MATTKEVMQSILKQYFKAWHSQDSSLVTSLFTPDGVYRVKPFGIEEYFGAEQIKQYWEANPISAQENPQPKILTYAFGDNVCFAEWENKFTTQKGSLKKTRGILLMTFENGKINELREHYLSIEE